MKKDIVVTAAFFGVLAVIAGAFGAHGLQAKLTARDLEIWHTAVQYQFYHIFALLFLSTLAAKNSKLINASYYLFSLGILFFSGSLYLLSCREILGFSWLIYMGPITPIGGLLFIIGWITTGLAAYKNL